MKKLLLSLLLLASVKSYSQTYISLSNTFYNSQGTFGDKSSPAIEIGKQFGPLSLGFDIGRTNCSKVSGKDTTLYLEIRPNINVFQQGKFTNTLTIGGGICPMATQGFMTEFSSGIEYAYTETWHININFGQYYFSGKSSSNYSSAPSFIGLNIIYYLKPFKIKQ